MQLTFAQGELDSPDVQDLLTMHWRAMHAASPPHSCHVLELDTLRAPAITFWSAREQGRLVAVGALKQLAPDHGEIKSMRTASTDLGRGFGAAMLDEIIGEAQARGISGSAWRRAARPHSHPRSACTSEPAFGHAGRSAAIRPASSPYS